MQPPPQPPPQVPTGPYAPYPYPPPYYAPPPRSDSGKIILIVIVVVIVLVAIPIVLAAVLYFMVSGLVGGPGPGPQTMGISVSRAGTNWSAVIIGTSGTFLPESTFLVLRNSPGGPTLGATAFSSLDWPRDRALYEDSDPTIFEIRAGDSLSIDAGTYPAGTTMEIRTSESILTALTLQ